MSSILVCIFLINLSECSFILDTIKPSSLTNSSLTNQMSKSSNFNLSFSTNSSFDSSTNSSFKSSFKNQDQQARNGRFLFKKLLNLVDSTSCNSGCCSKAGCSNSLFGFNSDCCCSPRFVDDGLEPDNRHKYPDHKKRNQYQKSTNSAQKHFTTKKNQPTEVRKTYYDKIKENEKVLEKWPDDLSKIKFKKINKNKNIDLNRDKNLNLNVDKNLNLNIDKNLDSNIDKNLDLKIDQTKTLELLNPIQNEQQTYLLIDLNESSKDQQKLSLFNANDYIKRLNRNVNQSSNRLSTTAISENKFETDEQTSSDEFYLKKNNKSQKMSELSRSQIVYGELIKRMLH